MSRGINGKAVNEIIIDLGNTHSLIDWACSRNMGLHVIKKVNSKIDLANGQLENLKEVTEAWHLTLAHTAVDMNF